MIHLILIQSVIHTKLFAHKDFLDDVYIMAPCIKPNNVLLDDSSSIIDKEETEHDNNKVDAGAIRSEYISVESML